MIISELYQTEITCNKYNANKNDNEITVTVTLKDFNEQPVRGKEVTLTCDKGYFHRKNSENITGTSTQSITVETNSSGQLTAMYTASDSGLVTFSANHTKIQCLISGWEEISLNHGKLYVNEAIRCAELKFNYSNSINITSTSSTNLVVINEIKSYPPLHDLMVIGNRADVRVALSPTGQITYRGENTTTLSGLTATFFWHY